MTTGDIRRYVRFTSPSAEGRTAYGLREGDTVRELEGDLFANPRPTGRMFPLSQVRLELPVDPARVQKIIGVTGNFARPGQPRRKIPHPRLFAKFATGLIPTGADIECMPECHHIHHEGEMVAVIGKQGRFLTVEQAPDYVFGVAVGNDVADGGWYSETEGLQTPSRLLAKGNDTWCPIGEEIVAGLNYDDLALEIRQNGQVASKIRTSEMLSSVAEVVSYLSVYMTLLPGDLIYMGTPNPNPDLREMKTGDVVEVELEGVGVVRNRVVEMKGGLPLPTP